MVRESDSEDEAELDAYSDFDALDGGEVEVSPEDEEALAAFMVSMHMFMKHKCKACTLLDVAY